MCSYTHQLPGLFGVAEVISTLGTTPAVVVRIDDITRSSGAGSGSWAASSMAR